MKKALAFLLMLCMLFTSVAMAETGATEPSYTYNSAASEFPTNWSPHSNQTAVDNDILQYIRNGFYDFDFNEDLDGYVVVPDAVVDFPVDVTADYVGEEWNIEEGETARAWKFTLRSDLKWQDGTPITAQDYVTSAELLLNPQAQNYRADSLYSGNMVVENAEAYLKQGLASPVSFGAVMAEEGTDLEGFLAAHGEEKGYINWSFSFGDTYDFDAKAWTGAAEDAVVETALTVQELYDFYTTGEGMTMASSWGATAEDMLSYVPDELYINYVQYPDEMSFDQVGVKALNDTDLVLILAKPLEGFYLYYSLTDTWLVNEEMYKACETVSDGVYSNTYGTSAETTMSFGPYMLTSFQSDKVYTLEKNPYWYGYNDEANEGRYQTTKIQVDYVAEPSTRVEMFLNGKLDVVGLDANYMDEYSTSDYCYYDEGDSVFAMVFNPDMDALKTAQENAGENINKTILTVKDFRIAMSLAMDRQAFCLATSPTNAPAFALYGSQIVADPENGVFYRTTDVAKQVVVNFWELGDEIGEGKLYPTVDDAIDSLTGYNLEMAKTYFDSAYDTAIAEGLMDENDVVEIMIGTPNGTADFYNSGYEFIVNNYTEAVKGTKLEGKLTFKRDDTLGNGFAEALRTNRVDMLFGVGWTGSTFDPYGLIEAYISENYQYDPAWKPAETEVTIELNGESYTTDVITWYDGMMGEEITVTKTGTEETATLDVYTDANIRIQVLGALEGTILQNYDFIPLMGDSTAKLKGMQIEYYIEDEVFPLSRGGVKYMTYNYDDAAWDAYVAEQGGTLNYK